MFVLPNGRTGFEGLPQIGTRVVYTVVVDSKTGIPRADDVHWDPVLTPSVSSASPQQWAADAPWRRGRGSAACAETHGEDACPWTKS